MTSHADETRLRALGTSIDRLLEAKRSSARVHTLQLIVASGLRLNRPISSILSRELLLFTEAVENFTNFKANKFSRSLASVDIAEAPYRHKYLKRADATARPRYPAAMAFDRLVGWQYIGAGGNDPSAENDWYQRLADDFAGCATLWVTQRSSEDMATPVSSAFLLLTGGVKHKRRDDLLFTISKMMRDVLVELLVAGHEVAIDEAIGRAVLHHMGSERSPRLPIAPDVEIQLDAYSRALQGSIPLLVTGEAGSGKLAVCREIHRRREKLLMERFLTRGYDGISRYRGNQFCLIRATSLTGGQISVRRRLAAELVGSGVTATGGSSPFIVIDDAQLLSNAAQDEVNALLEDVTSLEVEYLRASGNDPGAWSLRPKFVLTTLPGLDVLVASGAFSASLFAQASAFEVICPPLRERFSDDVDLDAIVAYVLSVVASALEITPPSGFVDEFRALVRDQYWPGNFRDLNNHAIRILLEREGRMS